MNRGTSFALHIKPMFNDTDIACMGFRFDLTNYENVKTGSEGILRRLKGEGGAVMPKEDAGGPWPNEWIDLFERWIREGHPE